ncbi:hypothetical protein LZ31DRAFT_227202 [Colletotrichum somersetense]|nr:hypothetical protein LZ31DRAFT_227202 [Colletotrichum somersetense]
MPPASLSPAQSPHRVPVGLNDCGHRSLCSLKPTGRRQLSITVIIKSHPAWTASPMHRRLGSSSSSSSSSSSPSRPSTGRRQSENGARPRGSSVPASVRIPGPPRLGMKYDGCSSPPARALTASQPLPPRRRRTRLRPCCLARIRSAVIHQPSAISHQPFSHLSQPASCSLPYGLSQPARGRST